jgi:type I restriction enzyme R subunit
MIDHFLKHVIGRQLIGGQARAMVVTSGIMRAIDYFFAFQDYLQKCKSQFKAIVAFSGQHEYKGNQVTEKSLNGFPPGQITAKITEDHYRFLSVADKFQTGYDEPLLHTMYIDKELNGIKAVQTLSRLNRAHPKKHDTFVLDFYNELDVIEKAFGPYYRTTILSNETDPNKLHDLKSRLDGYQVYDQKAVDLLIELYLSTGTRRDELDPVLDASVANYILLSEDDQVDFKSRSKSFVRAYQFLASILPYGHIEWEKLSVFLNFLIPKLPSPKEEDFSKGILETIDIESYRAEIQASQSIVLPDQDGELNPISPE